MTIRSEEEILKAIKKEENRLKRIFKKEAESKLDVAVSLIERAAFLRVHIEELEADINENGFTEPFTQSPDVPPYDRERVVVKQFNTMGTSYRNTMKQLNDLLPVNVVIKDDKNDLIDFIKNK